jgi:hypothetical protein
MRAFLLFLLVAGAAVYAGLIGYERQAQAYALQCARASDGTDSAIVDCFHRYGLETPEDLN